MQKKIKTLRESEKEHLQRVLEITDWDLKKTANLLKVPFTRVIQKIRNYGLKKAGPE